jgi:phage baseplate assembly protein W
MVSTGMSRTSGATLSGDEHLAQSCEDIVTTPLGTRVMRRDYGCLLAELIDRPLNRATCSPRWPSPSRSPGGNRASRCGR